MKRVIIESPFRGENAYQQERNRRYALECMKDSMLRGEAPFLSHLLYTQVTNENVPEERRLGIELGLCWGELAEKTIVYTDNGISPGMKEGIDHSLKFNRPIEYRKLNDITDEVEVFRKNSLDKLLKAISKFFDVSIFDLKSRSRIELVIDARHVFMKVSKEIYPNMSLLEIGTAVNRDHSTVINGINDVLRIKRKRSKYNLFVASKYMSQCLQDHQN